MNDAQPYGGLEFQKIRPTGIAQKNALRLNRSRNRLTILRGKARLRKSVR